MEDKEKEVELQFVASESIRGGVYVNAAYARSSRKETVIDFVFTDSEIESEDGIVVGGVLQSRIILTSKTLLELRDMIDQHISENYPQPQG